MLIVWSIVLKCLNLLQYSWRVCDDILFVDTLYIRRQSKKCQSKYLIKRIWMKLIHMVFLDQNTKCVKSLKPKRRKTITKHEKVLLLTFPFFSIITLNSGCIKYFLNFLHNLSFKILLCTRNNSETFAYKCFIGIL